MDSDLESVALNIVLFMNPYYHEMNHIEYLKFRKRNSNLLCNKICDEIKINKPYSFWNKYNDIFLNNNPIHYLNENYKSNLGYSINDSIFTYKYHLHMILSRISILEHVNKHNFNINVEQIYRINCLLNTNDRNILYAICEHFNINKPGFYNELYDLTTNIDHIKPFILAELKAILFKNFHKNKYEINMDWINNYYHGKTILYSSYEVYSSGIDKYTKGRFMSINNNYIHLYNNNKMLGEQNIYIHKNTSQYRFHLVDNLYDEFIEECLKLNIMDGFYKHPFINVINNWKNIDIWFE